MVTHLLGVLEVFTTPVCSTQRQALKFCNRLQVSKQLLLGLGDEDFLAETGTVVSQERYRQSMIRTITKLIYAQVRVEQQLHSSCRFAKVCGHAEDLEILHQYWLSTLCTVCAAPRDAPQHDCITHCIGNAIFRHQPARCSCSTAYAPRAAQCIFRSVGHCGSQRKFNLLREESEGYAKVITLLNRPAPSGLSEATADAVVRIASENRVYYVI